MNFIILILLFIIFITLPFVPGIIELLSPMDDKPLSIKMEYSKDARYFGKSFKKILRDSLKKAKFKNNMTEVKLSSGLEKIEIIHSGFSPDEKTFEHILLISGNLVTKGPNNFNKEIYIEGNASFGHGNMIRAAVVNKDAKLHGNAKIIRWLDVDGNIEASEGIDLGISASCGKKLQLSTGCKFRRLLGNPITTFKDILPVHYSIEKNEKNVSTANAVGLTYFNKIINEDMIYDKPANVKGNLIVNGNIEINNEFTIKGSIKASGKVTINTVKRVNIIGNIISDDIITMKGDIKIYGNIFSQEEVLLEGVDVGKIDKVKSVIAKKKLTLGKNVVIYGFVLTEGAGIVL